MRERAAVSTVLGLLLATGWAANHVTGLFPVYRADRGISTLTLDVAFGVYALGLLPGLLGGGVVSDRVGRRRVVLPGATLAALGTVVLSLDAGAVDLVAGRFVVGLGAGLTFAAGTAWAADLAGRTGAVLAGVFLSAGFAVGPLASGALARFAPGPLLTPYVVSFVLSLVAVVAATVATGAGASARSAAREAPSSPDTWSAEESLPAQSVRSAAAWALPVGALVFASVSVPLVTLPARLPEGVGGPLLVGVASVLSLGTGSAVQQLARVRSWGPRTGVVGALCTVVGMATVAGAGARISLPVFLAACVVLGLAYGLCLREGLLDVEALSPPGRRGALTGVFYVTTYLGFSLPLLLTVTEPALGVRTPVLVVAGLAAVVATSRTWRLRHGHPVR